MKHIPQTFLPKHPDRVTVKKKRNLRKTEKALSKVEDILFASSPDSTPENFSRRRLKLEWKNILDFYFLEKVVNLYFKWPCIHILHTLCHTIPRSTPKGRLGKGDASSEKGGEKKAQKWIYKNFSETFLFFTNRQSKFCSVTILRNSPPFSLALYACICA